MTSDPIADFITCIRNGNRARLPEIKVGHSKVKENIARILKEEGYVNDYAVEGEKVKTIKVKLKYRGRKGLVEHIERMSKPGLRRYVGSTEIPRVLGGMGTVILSTSSGIMTANQARKNNVGGELVCCVW
ncbi:MAG: 30S ribosomal protein S8 [Verrucomicrobia bacterium]|nr:30S ribosomal protein S8 [Verrucomicrobiota bacterium]MCF7707829.1 30S ribosomal protein S8 [Verrucomicrobiota bacterium]